MMRVYLDNCCYNRPFDDQSQVGFERNRLSPNAIRDCFQMWLTTALSAPTPQFENSQLASSPISTNRNSCERKRGVSRLWRSRAEQNDDSKRGVVSHIEKRPLIACAVRHLRSKTMWRRQMQMTDNELTVKCMNVLMDSVGPVDAERFVSIVNLNHFDYTEWRKDHLFVGETVDTLVDKIRAFEKEHSELAEVAHA